MHSRRPQSVLHQVEYQCRYLGVFPGPTASFERLLDDLGVVLPGGIQVHDLVRLGLARPKYSYLFPEAFFRSWDGFPVLPIPDGVVKDFEWASALWLWEHAPRSDWYAADKPCQAYIHPLDREGDPIGSSILDHAIRWEEVEEEGRRELLESPRLSHAVHLFPYWEAYRLHDLSKALPICSPIPNTPDVRQRVEALLARLDEYVATSSHAIRGVTDRWDERTKLFEVISLYRTARGVKRHARVDGVDLAEVARTVVARSSITPAEFALQIRELLLVTWNDWASREGGAFAPRVLREHLREDVDLGREILEHTIGREVDPLDQFWNPPDFNPRRWARLKDVLIFEDWEAKESFVEYAPLYLKETARLWAGQLKVDRQLLAELCRLGWGRSVGFRRFVLAFHRLHCHFRGRATDVGHLVHLTVETPMAYLTLCALETEKLLYEAFRLVWTVPRKAPNLNALFGAMFGRLADAFDLDVSQVDLEALLRKHTRLHNLEQTRELPFCRLDDIGTEEKAEFVARAFVNVAILRNYVAHHDCMDTQLIYSGLAMVPIESMLALVVLNLQALPSLAIDEDANEHL